jgi:sulfatase modifying factor 1
LVKLETERRALEEGRKRLEMAKLTPPKTVVPPPAADPDAGPAKAETGAVGKTLEVGLPGGKVMRFCYCPAGKFTMGSPVSEPGHDTDENQVSVTISQGFWMAETEVTQAEWQSVMGTDPSSFKGANLPVEQVSWEDAQEMIRKLNQTARPPSGFKFALPTEAQWEYACRAGTQTAYAFGSQLSPQEANFGRSQTVSVKSYPPNRWGLYDMHGNVWEWCEDWLGDKLQGGVDPRGDSSGVIRVRRGGSRDNDAVACRAAGREGLDPGVRSVNLGFRPALVPSR